MKISKYSLFIFLICLFNTNAKAQEQTINKGSISDQFDYVIKKSYTFNEKGKTYEVVHLDYMLALKAHALDSLKVIQIKLENAKSKITPLQEEINTIKTNLSNSEKSLALTKDEKDNMNLLGTPMSKESYSLTMWSVIVTLFVLLLFFVFRFKNSNAVTKTTKNALENLENEYKEHRTVALEREQKVMRQLQDELNKHKEN